MVTVVRVGRVVVLIALAFMSISFVMGLGTPSTGPLEKVALMGLIGACIYAAVKVTTLSERVVHRLRG